MSEEKQETNFERLKRKSAENRTHWITEFVKEGKITPVYIDTDSIIYKETGTNTDIFITQKEADTLQRLFNISKEKIGGPFKFNSPIWNNVRSYMDELAKKYNITVGKGNWKVDLKTLNIMYYGEENG